MADDLIINRIANRIMNNEISVVVMGSTGTGKSSLCNSLSGGS